MSCDGQAEGDFRKGRAERRSEDGVGRRSYRVKKLLPVKIQLRHDRFVLKGSYERMSRGTGRNQQFRGLKNFAVSKFHSFIMNITSQLLPFNFSSKSLTSLLETVCATYC